MSSEENDPTGVRMVRWLVDLGCGDTAVVLTPEDEALAEPSDSWRCQECGRRSTVTAVHRVGWETAPRLKLRGET
jgi:hypothetical protein